MTDQESELHKWLRLPPEEQKWIPIGDMQVGYYICDARNFIVGRWNGVCFDYLRHKFSFTFPDTEDHWDTGTPYGTVKPIRYLGESL